MKLLVIAKLRVEGIHAWRDCPLKEVAFLRHPHRHEFHITCTKAVTHGDRDVEIIMLKRAVAKHLADLYGTPCDFGTQSCEQIAAGLFRHFELDSCEVLEDGENGGLVLL